MRVLYELCAQAEKYAREGNRAKAAAALTEAYETIRPEIEKARARLELRTLYGYFCVLYQSAQVCQGQPYLWMESGPQAINTKAYHKTGNRSSLDFRWNKWRESPERWFDVACRCPSL